tara:strand:- start:489 stop:782 length:294 start_codon:yes stop_codon:yes gene_type:complete
VGTKKIVIIIYCKSIIINKAIMTSPTSFMELIGEEYFKEDVSLESLTQDLKNMDTSFAENKTMWTRNHSITYRKTQQKINTLKKEDKVMPETTHKLG